jgi:hypothetical protein
MELYILQIKTSALCLVRVTQDSQLTTLKLSGEPINEIDQPSTYVDRLINRLVEQEIYSLDQLSVSLSYDDLSNEDLKEWGALLIQAKTSNIRKLRNYFADSVAPSDQLSISEVGVHCKSADGVYQATIPFTNIGIEKSKTSALVPQLTQALTEDSEQLALLRAQLLDLDQRVETLEEKANEGALSTAKEEPYRWPITLCSIHGPDLALNSKWFFRELLCSGKQGKKITCGSDLMTLVSSKNFFPIKTYIPEGYFFFLPKSPVSIHSETLKPKLLNLVYGVISSDPHDTLPAIKAWLASHSIPFHQDR